MRTVTSLLSVVAAIVLLTLFAPLLVCIAVAVLIDTRCAPIFCQRRIGQCDRAFTIYKFRTMTNQRDSNGRLLPDEQRLTRWGSLLRHTSLDEIPQLWNIVRGEMAFVGPRPLPPDYLPRYSERQRRRHEVRPGITGWAQVNGRNALSWEGKFDFDVWYVDHKSLGLDVKILWLTLIKVVRGDGVSQVGHATMPEFMGPEFMGPEFMGPEFMGPELMGNRRGAGEMGFVPASSEAQKK